MTRIDAAKIAAASLCLAAGVVAYVAFRGKGVPGERSYFYDLSEERLYTARTTELLPTDGVGGAPGDGVLAFVYTCKGGKERNIAFLQTFTPELSAKMREADAAHSAGRPPPEEIQDRVFLSSNTLVRRVGSGDWVPRSSDEGQAIIAILTRPCEGGGFPKLCSPDD